MTRPRAVVFDLDGTLVDSWAVHLRCLRSACAAAGTAPPGAARLAAAQRPTDLATLAALTSPAAAPAALAAYHDALRATLAAGPVPVMAGAAETLALLRRAGLATGVCTGRSRAGAAALLAAAGLPVPLLAAREDAAAPKPAPDGLRHALARLAVRAADALYAGDTGDDVQQGRSAAVRTVLVRPGTLLTTIRREVRWVN